MVRMIPANLSLKTESKAEEKVFYDLQGGGSHLNRLLPKNEFQYIEREME